MVISLSMGVGFVLAAWAVMGNDAVQTIGTFLSSNAERTAKSTQMLFLCSITSGVLLMGWWLNHGDPAWGRLTADTNAFPLPHPLSWIYLIPPAAVLVLTRWGAPVSTSFLVLTAFVPSNSLKLLLNSFSGYVMAFVLAIVVYGLLMWILEKKVFRSHEEGTPAKDYWFVLQWLSTGWLWSQWLVQDMANIYVYLPRQLNLTEMALSALMLCIGLCLLVWSGGGPIQGVLRSKINTHDLRSASVIDFLFGCVLFWKANITQFPLSTTWVFLGLLAGREIAVRARLRLSDRQPLQKVLGSDLLKAGIGIIVSLLVAIAIQPLKALG